MIALKHFAIFLQFPLSIASQSPASRQIVPPAARENTERQSRDVKLCTPPMHFPIFLRIPNLTHLLPALAGESDCSPLSCILQYFCRSMVSTHLLPSITGRSDCELPLFIRESSCRSQSLIHLLRVVIGRSHCGPLSRISQCCFYRID